MIQSGGIHPFRVSSLVGAAHQSPLALQSQHDIRWQIEAQSRFADGSMAISEEGRRSVKIVTVGTSIDLERLEGCIRDNNGEQDDVREVEDRIPGEQI